MTCVTVDLLPNPTKKAIIMKKKRKIKRIINQIEASIFFI